MKLKIYHILLLTFLFLTFALTSTLLVLSIIETSTLTGDLTDNILFIVCFILLLAFEVLEIVNTFVSFKTGSAFIKPLTFDDDKKINSPLLTIMTIVALIIMGVMIFFIMTIFDKTLPFGDSPNTLKFLLISFFTLVLVDVLFIDLFPLLGKEDKAFQNKK